MPGPVAITGTGSSTTPLEIPEGAQSLRVDLACSGGFFVVGTGANAAGDRGGQCGGGVSHFVLPLPDRPTARVDITMHGTGQGDGGGESFAATVAFSTDPKYVDPQVDSDCVHIGSVYSAIANAENLVTGGSTQGWAELIDGAVDELRDMTPSPLIAPQVATLSGWLAAPPEPGTLYTDQPPAVSGAQSIIGQVCNDNGSVIGVALGDQPTATGLSPAPSPSVDPEALTLTGTGSGQKDVEVPDGARSLRIDLACADGTFVISAGGDLGDDRVGRCGGVSHLIIALPDSARVRVTVEVYEGGGTGVADRAFAATVAFSSEPKPTDSAVAADCADIGVVDTASQDADDGYAAGDLSAQGWTDKRDEAITALDELIDRGPSPLIAPQVEALRAWLGTVTQAGTLLGERPLDVQHAENLIGQLCSDNGTTVTVTPAYGG
jgi:hypothetical protein